MVNGLAGKHDSNSEIVMNLVLAKSFNYPKKRPFKLTAA